MTTSRAGIAGVLTGRRTTWLVLAAMVVAAIAVIGLLRTAAAPSAVQALPTGTPPTSTTNLTVASLSASASRDRYALCVKVVGDDGPRSSQVSRSAAIWYSTSVSASVRGLSLTAPAREEDVLDTGQMVVVGRHRTNEIPVPDPIAGPPHRGPAGGSVQCRSGRR